MWFAAHFPSRKLYLNYQEIVSLRNIFHDDNELFQHYYRTFYFNILISV